MCEGKGELIRRFASWFHLLDVVDDGALVAVLVDEPELHFLVLLVGQGKVDGGALELDNIWVVQLGHCDCKERQMVSKGRKRKWRDGMRRVAANRRWGGGAGGFS